MGKTTKQIWRYIEYYNRRQDGRRNRASNQRLPIDREQDELLIVGILKKAST